MSEAVPSVVSDAEVSESLTVNPPTFPSPSGWLSGWTYRKAHAVVGSTVGELTNYQIRIVVHYGSGTDSGEHVYLGGKCRSDFGDIRFTSDDGVTELAYWIEDKVDGDYAVIWVKVPYIPTYPSYSVIFIYYGNPNATTTSNPYNTWDFFEDWEGTRDSNWVDGGGFTSANWEYASPALKTGNYRLHFKTGRADEEWDNMWWKGKTFDNFRFIAYVRADYPDDDSGIIFRSQGTEVGSTRDAPGYKLILPRAGAQYFILARINSDGSNITLAQYSAVNTSDIVRFEVMCYGSSLKVRIERPPSNYLTTLLATDTMWMTGYIGLAVTEWDANRNPSFDTFCVGKYVDPEPTNGDWGSEESGLTEAISSVSSDALAVTTTDVSAYTAESIPTVLSDAEAVTVAEVTTYPAEAIESVSGDALSTTVMGVGGYPSESIAGVVSDAVTVTSTEVTTVPAKKVEVPWWVIILITLGLIEAGRRRKGK